MRQSKADTEMIHARVDGKLKRSTQKIFSDHGLSTTDAIRIFLTQVELHKGLPFPVEVPNAETIAAMEEARDPSKLKHFSSAREMIGEMLNEV